MIKERGVVSLLFLIVTLLCGCSHKTTAINYEANNSSFINKLSSCENLDTAIIESLDLYYLNSLVYYEIKYNNNDEDYHLLFIYRFNSFDIFFSLNDESDCIEYYGSSYTDFLDAKKNGVHISYSQEEINKLIEDNTTK